MTNKTPFVTTSHVIATVFEKEHKKVVGAIRSACDKLSVDDPDELQRHHLNYLLTDLTVQVGKGATREIKGYLITYEGAKNLVEGFSGAKAKELAPKFLTELMTMPEQPERRAAPKAPLPEPLAAQDTALEDVARSLARAMFAGSHPTPASPPQEPPKEAPQPTPQPCEAQEDAPKVTVTPAEAFIKMQEICDARVEAFESENTELKSEIATLKARVIELELSNDPAFLDTVVLRLIRSEGQCQALIDECLTIRGIYEKALDNGVPRHKCDLRFPALSKIDMTVSNRVVDPDSKLEKLITSLKK